MTTKKVPVIAGTRVAIGEIGVVDKPKPQHTMREPGFRPHPTEMPEAVGTKNVLLVPREKKEKKEKK